MQKAYAKIKDNFVIDKVIGFAVKPDGQWIDLPTELAFCSKPIYFDGSTFSIIEDEANQTIEERLAKAEIENTKLKAELEVTQAVVDELLFGGVSV